MRTFDNQLKSKARWGRRGWPPLIANVNISNIKFFNNNDFYVLFHKRTIYDGYGYGVRRKKCKKNQDNTETKSFNYLDDNIILVFDAQLPDCQSEHFLLENAQLRIYVYEINLQNMIEFPHNTLI